MVPGKKVGLKIWTFRLALLLPLAGMLALLEIGARVLAYQSDSELRRGLDGVGRVVTKGELSLQHIIRWHANPKLIYELIPNLSGSFRGQPLAINELGFRGPSVQPVKAPDGFRVGGSGDSVMFGGGVADDEVYMAQLGARLTQRLGGRTVDWVNAAVPGYNTVNEVETLERKLLQLAPDVVIVDHVRNDLYLPGFLQKRQLYFSLRQSFLADWVRNRLGGVHVPDSGLQRPPDAFREQNFSGREALIPEQYRQITGIEAFRRAVHRLAELAREHGFRVIVFAHFGVEPEPRAVLRDAGLELINGYPSIREYLSERGRADYVGSALTVSADDSHPSALHHRMIAERLVDHVVGGAKDAESAQVLQGG